MSNVKSVMIVGVGGQGTLLASRVLGSAMLSQGVDVKVSEVHGMSQRGGSVVTYVRYGDKVYSPIIAQGEADVLLAFEALEAARGECRLIVEDGAETNLIVAGMDGTPRKGCVTLNGEIYAVGSTARLTTDEDDRPRCIVMNPFQNRHTNSSLYK